MVNNLKTEMIFPRGSTGNNGNKTQTDLFLHINGRKKEWKKVTPDKQISNVSSQGEDIYFLGENEYLKITKTAKKKW
jgi:hypothetical protein